MARGENGRDEAIANRLRLLREAEGENNSSAWARRMGMGVQQYSNYENGFPLPRDAGQLLWPQQFRG
jgi:hypothetical protein